MGIEIVQARLQKGQNIISVRIRWTCNYCKETAHEQVELVGIYSSADRIFSGGPRHLLASDEFDVVPPGFVQQPPTAVPWWGLICAACDKALDAQARLGRGEAP